MGFTKQHPLPASLWEDGGGSAEQHEHLCWVKPAGGSVLSPEGELEGAK